MVDSNKLVEAHYTETYKALFTLGPMALRGVMLLNAGAAIALLAFVGHLVRPELPISYLVGRLSWAFGLLIGGAALCGVAGIMGYISQLFLFESAKYPHDKPRERNASYWLWASMGTVALALLCFIAGMATALFAMTGMN